MIALGRVRAMAVMAALAWSLHWIAYLPFAQTTTTIYLPLVASTPGPLIGVQIESSVAASRPLLAPGIVQANIDWSLAEPEPGMYVWPDKLDGLENLPHKTILGSRATPVWARMLPEYRCSPPRRDAWQAHVDFANAAIDRYQVNGWAIWNEPEAPPAALGYDGWWFGCWGDQAELYGQFAGYVYAGIKAQHPNVAVIVGELLAEKPDWWARAQAAGARGDILSIHAYWHYGGNDRYAWRERAAAYHAISPGMPLLLSETAVLCAVDCGAGFEQAKLEHWRGLRDGYAEARLAGYVWYPLAFNDWMWSDLYPGPAYDEYRGGMQ